MFLTGYEEDFILENVRIMQEFDTSNFLSNARSAISGKVETVNVALKLNYYKNALEKAINAFDGIKVDRLKIKEFLDNYNGNSINGITGRDITSGTNIVFKPQYLQQYTDLVGATLDQVINGTATDQDITRFSSGDIPYKVEKQVVRNFVCYGGNIKDIKRVDQTSIVNIDKDFINTKLLPFINSYEKIKSDTITEALSVQRAISEMTANIKAMQDTINKMKMDGSVPEDRIPQLNQLSYNALRGMLIAYFH